MLNPNKVFELMKTLLETWNIKIKVKEVGIKFPERNWKIPRDIYSSTKHKKHTHFAHRNTRCDRHECNKHVSTL